MNTYIFLKNRVALSALFFLFTSCSIFAQRLIEVQRNVILMGSTFQITIVETDSLLAEKYIDKAIEEIERIENLISEWRSYTPVSQVNVNAGIQAVKVPNELLQLTQRAIEYSKITNGAFDISIVAMDKIWNFDEFYMEALPREEILQEAIKNVGYEKIIIDTLNSTIFLSQKGMKIGFGSIGKSYAADKASQLLQSFGVLAGMINASGDIASWGKNAQQKPWLIGIKNPFKRHGIAKILKLKNAGIATSGSYEKYIEIDNIRYGHIINPKTGMPSTGLTSVTVYGASAEFSNFLSTSIMVLGQKKGQLLLKKYKQYKAIFITDKGKIIK